MRSSEDVQKLIRNAEMHSDPEANQAVLTDLLDQFDKTQEQEPAVMQPSIGRTIMKSPITKLAAAAVIVIAVLIGMNQLVGSAGSVAWGEVVRNIEASPGFVFRLRQTYIREETGTIELNTMVYGSAQYGVRHDGYNDEDVTVQIYAPLSDGAMTAVDHRSRTYSRRALPDDARAEIESMDPKEALREFLSAEYTKLGRKAVEGVEAEGIEIHRPSESRANSQVVMQLWVAVDTGLPILVEVDTVGKNGMLEVHTVQDDFRWNVELDASEFEPDIPEDYTLMEVEIDADDRTSFKPTVNSDSQKVVGAKLHKWRLEEKRDKYYHLESEDGQAGAMLPESWADSPEHAVRVMEELDLLKQQGNRELARVSEIEVTGQLDSRYLFYKYALSDGQVIEDGGFDPDLTNPRTLVGERREELSQLLGERRKQEEEGQELAATEERQVQGRVFTFKKRRFVLSDGTEIVYSIGRLKDD